MKKIVICEFHHFHTEVFPVYEYYFSRLFPAQELQFVYYVIPDRNAEISKQYKSVKSIYKNTIYLFCAKTGLRSIYFKQRIKKMLRQENPDWIIFNSLDRGRTQAAFNAINSEKKIGIIHNPEYFKAQKTPGYYFVLGKSLFHKYSLANGYFLPFIAAPTTPKQNNSDFIISILGNIQFKRRNYPRLIDIASLFKQNSIDHIKFNIVGSSTHRDYPKLTKMIEDKALTDYFIFHHELDDEAFMQEVVNSKFIMPLLYSDKKYLENKITASLSHAAANDIPLIITDHTASYWQFDETEAVIYKSDQDLIKQLMDMNTETYEYIRQNFKEKTSAALVENIDLLKSLNL